VCSPYETQVLNSRRPRRHDCILSVKADSVTLGPFSLDSCSKTCIRPKLQFTLSAVTVTLILMNDTSIYPIQLQTVSSVFKHLSRQFLRFLCMNYILSRISLYDVFCDDVHSCVLSAATMKMMMMMMMTFHRTSSWCWAFHYDDLHCYQVQKDLSLSRTLIAMSVFILRYRTVQKVDG